MSAIAGGRSLSLQARETSIKLHDLSSIDGTQSLVESFQYAVTARKTSQRCQRRIHCLSGPIIGQFPAFITPQA